MGASTAIDDTSTTNVASSLAALARVRGLTVASYSIYAFPFYALTGTAAGNYFNLTSLSGSPTLSITKATLTGTIANQTKVYGSDDPTLPNVTRSEERSVGKTNWMGASTAIDDTSTTNVASSLASLARVTGETVASYSINNSTFNALTATAAGNYFNLTSLSGSPTLSITKATLTGTIANQTKVYGSDDPTLPNVTLAGQINRSVINWMGASTAIDDTSTTNVASSLASLARAVGETVASFRI